MNHDLKFACELIRKCESDLGYKLTDGNKRDLLADNRNDWTLEYIRRLVADAAKTQEQGESVMKEYRLGSAEFVCAPSLVALATKKVPYTIDGETVVFKT
jgi:hypothetical protein